jgi:diguanylate cyclase (GGDEF)-like protein
MGLTQENANTVALNMLYEITRSIKRNNELMYMLPSIYEILNKYLCIDDLCVWIKNQEDKSFTLSYTRNKSVGKDYFNTLKLDSQLEKNNLREKLFFVSATNELLSIDNLEEEDIKKVPDEIKLLLPIFDRNELIGMVGFVDMHPTKRLLLPEYLMTLTIVATQISTAVLNDKLNRQVMSVFEISNATKEIAKIIESQYELRYVVPIMGEIIDKYLKNALVYIFINSEDGPMDLYWPNSYSASRINPLLEKMKESNDVVFTGDNKAVAIPVMVKNKIYGAVVADGKITEIDEREIELLKELSKQCNITINRACTYAETVKYATVDALTGLDNRRQLDKRLLQEASLVMRTKRILSLLMIDIDHFKQINDTHGHSVGDYVLKEVANIIKAAIREYDVAGRYGGEEFVVIMPDTNLEGALIVAERLRTSMEESRFNISKFGSSKAETIQLTLSVGIAEYGSTDKNPADIYEEADIALYKAKQEGRNRVISFSNS